MTKVHAPIYSATKPLLLTINVDRQAVFPRDRAAALGGARADGNMPFTSLTPSVRCWSLKQTSGALDPSPAGGGAYGQPGHE